MQLTMAGRSGPEALGGAVNYSGRALPFEIEIQDGFYIGHINKLGVFCRVKHEDSADIVYPVKVNAYRAFIGLYKQQVADGSNLN